MLFLSLPPFPWDEKGIKKEITSQGNYLLRTLDYCFFVLAGREFSGVLFFKRKDTQEVGKNKTKRSLPLEFSFFFPSFSLLTLAGRRKLSQELKEKESEGVKHNRFLLSAFRHFLSRHKKQRNKENVWTRKKQSVKEERILNPFSFLTSENSHFFVFFFQN